MPIRTVLAATPALLAFGLLAGALRAPGEPPDRRGKPSGTPVPAPYRYMPDRKVEGRAAVGQADPWARDAAAVVVSRGRFVLDQGALMGLDEAVRRDLLEYVGRAADRVSSAGAPPTFRRWTLREGQAGPERCGAGGQVRQWFPSNFEVEQADEAPVPVKILPAPGVVERACGARLEKARTGALEDLAAAGWSLGRVLVYEPGALRPDFLAGQSAGERLFRILPQAAPAVSPRLTVPPPAQYAPQYGRLVLPNAAEAWREGARALQPGGAGARAFGEVQTIELMPEVWVRRTVNDKGGPVGTPAIAYEVWEALEGVRCGAPAGVDPLAVPVVVKGPPAVSLGSYEAFRAPRPLPRASPTGAHPQERLVIGQAWDSADKPAIAVRKGDGWQPYCEALVLEHDPAPASLRSGDLLLLVLFSDAAPERLVEVLAALAGVDPAPIKADAEFMESLRDLRVRQTPK